jgi:hypothetical protein
VIPYVKAEWVQTQESVLILPLQGHLCSLEVMEAMEAKVQQWSLEARIQPLQPPPQVIRKTDK